MLRGQKKREKGKKKGERGRLEEKKGMINCKYFKSDKIRNFPQFKIGKEKWKKYSQRAHKINGSFFICKIAKLMVTYQN